MVKTHIFINKKKVIFILKFVSFCLFKALKGHLSRCEPHDLFINYYE